MPSTQPALPTASNVSVPWYAAYPAPKSSSPESMTREEVLAMMKGGEAVAGRDFLLIDLRRTDYEGGTIRGSINLPAQSLYPTIPTLYSMFKAAGLRKVIWYCSSSRGRGNRAAGWFEDYLLDRGEDGIRSIVLEGGIKGWATAGGEFATLMDGFDEQVWLGK